MRGHRVTLHRTGGRHALPRSSVGRLDVGGQQVEIEVVEVVGIDGSKPSRCHQDRAGVLSACRNHSPACGFSFSSTAVAGTWAASAVPIPRLE
jgi:hypothetical protein